MLSREGIKERAEDIPVGADRETSAVEYARKLMYVSRVGGCPERTPRPHDGRYSPIHGCHRLWCGLQWSLIIFDLHTLVLD